MRRWVLGFGIFSIRLHHWYSSDDARFWHDHSWFFVTLVLWGGYTDVSLFGRERMTPGVIRYRPALHRHTVEVDRGGCWTLVFTGPKVRRWGFWVGNKFRRSAKYFREYGHHPCQT